MFTSRTIAPALIAVAAVLSGCASMDGTQSGQVDQLAARNCKAVPADFVNRPKKSPTAAEQAEARLKLGRLAAERGGSGGIGNSTLSDLSRDCN